MAIARWPEFRGRATGSDGEAARQAPRERGQRLPAAFARFGTPGSPLDALRPQAYGLYLVHYVFVTWLQYALVGTRLPAAAKFVLVFTGAVAAGSATVAAARRLPGVARVI